jgi:hypothetical protein
MKDFIYFDDDYLTSYLSQIYEGLIQNKIEGIHEGRSLILWRNYRKTYIKTI